MPRIRSFILIVSGIVLGSGLARAGTWSLNDVSILLPLPKDPSEAGLLLAPQSPGKGGELLTHEALKLIPPLVRQDSPSFLRAVAIRLDPCFPDSDPSSTVCHPQIRLIWQPLIAVRGVGVMLTQDAAMHSFYELTPEDFRFLLSELARLNEPYSIAGLPLGIHPVVQSQGLAGAYWQALRSLLLRYAGATSLIRVTFMKLIQPGQIWDFGGFEIQGGRFTRMAIPRVNTRQQAFINLSAGPEDFAGGARPAPEGADTLNPILGSSSKLSGSLSITEARSFMDSLHRIENPRYHNAQTLDCVSCHVAQPVRSWLTRRFPELSPDTGAYKYESPLNLENRSRLQGSARVLRAFGYYGREPAFNQRVIHESAAVAEKIGSIPLSLDAACAR